MTWGTRTHVDPTAGVCLAPKLLTCPLCGVVKGRKGWNRPGLCADCRDVLSAAEKAIWRRAT